MRATAFAPAAEDMQRYEIMVILSGQLDEDAANAEVERINERIDNVDGVVTASTSWGRRELTHELAKNTHGWYVIYDLSLNHDGLIELERQMKIDENIVRFKTIRPDKHLLNNR